MKLIFFRLVWSVSLVLMAASGCAARTEVWHVQPPVVRAASSGPPPGLFSRKRRFDPNHSNSAVGVVERSLHERGIRFGTDGTPGSLYQFMQENYPVISAREARPGDVLFFNLGDGCGSHTGLVDLVDGDGRIIFREWRDGSARRSYVHPGQPRERRDDTRILNTFLRIKRPGDAPTTQYFSGEMLCSVVRPQG
jgi:hypothetical protein